ncbi:MAG TPA: serine/threonine-protein kinase [Thermoanaerobaculia bacterium]|nr:serine/threonine-protein kinase [Thermoanaerobaculia bacterium]
MSAGSRPIGRRRVSADSPWGSEEGREFLQERLAGYSRLLLLIVVGFFLAGWAIALAWHMGALVHGLPLATPYRLNLVEIAILAAMWAITRGGPLPPEILRTVDAAGNVLTSWAVIGMCFGFALSYRPDLIAVVALLGTHFYRAAVVPSEPSRTAWIAAISAAPLPVITFFAYDGVPRPGMPAAWGYASYAFLFSLMIVFLARRFSVVIYGLRETIRETRRLGPYTLVEKIGEGGMGAVYRAQHALLRRPTAIKILPPERAGEMDLARFEREVQMTSQLTSPHTVSIYDYGRTPDGLFYYAMEYLDGIDLEQLVRRDGPMPAARVAHVLRQVCEALGEAHRIGLIHRDVKPANILLCERGGRPDVAKVVDFGLVKSLSAAATGVTQENMVPGTPHYMSPESLREPDRVHARSDIYALGATAYFLLTGSPVFEGSLPEVFAHQLGTKPVPPSERLGREVPASLEALVLAALAKDATARPESADAFAAALARCGGLDAWTESEAAAWWRGPGARIKAARAGGSPPSRADATIERLPPASASTY